MRDCEKALQKHFNPKAFTMQVGGADGIDNDPVYGLYTKESVAVIFEPHYGQFVLLNEAYNDYPMIITVNAAIHYYNGFVRMYTSSERPQLTSIFKDRNDLAGLEVRWFHARCQYPKIKPDQLIVDAEGYDGEVISMILTYHRPQLIFFEHTLIPKSEYEMLKRTLKDHSYKLVASDQNQLWMLKHVL